MNKCKGKRTKVKKMLLAPCHFSSSASFRLCFFLFLFSSSFILHNSSLVFCAQSGSRPGGGTAQLGKQTLLLFILLLFSPLATGHSHLALPLGESLFGGDSQAQVFVGSGYSSLPSSSRVNRLSILMLRIPVRSPKGCTVGRCSGFDARRDD